MFKKKENRLSATRVQAYATQDEFCRIFAEEENALYLLAFLLTADASKAEKCFVAGLEDSIQGNRVFKEWVRSWSRRMIVRNAIQMISPGPGQANGAQQVSDSGAVTLDLGSELTAVLQLAPLERFVFVMSVLEGYSIQDCSILLNCTRQYIEIAQAEALQHTALAKADQKLPVVPRSDIGQTAHFLEPAPAA
jgi:DNA-directed RNA polymerase specialized sigma24 family protein